LSDRLAEIGGLDVHGLAILCYGPARHLDALLGENVGNPVIRKRFPAVLRGDELLD